MNQVILKQPAEISSALAPASETSALIHIIERAARDPSVDLDKLERLMGMHERILARDAKTAYASALADMQPKLPIIQERGAIKIGDDAKKWQKYALWEDINEAIKPILAEHGFALTFRTPQTDGKIAVTGVLSHRNGHSEETTMILPADQSGSKNAVQAIGSSTSYGKRYTAGALLNLTSRGQDDDGKMGGDNEHLSDEQVATLENLITETGGNIAKFCAFAKVETLADIFASRYEAAVAAVKRAGEDRKKAQQP